MRFMMAVLLGGMLAVGSMIINQKPDRQPGAMTAAFQMSEDGMANFDATRDVPHMILLPTSDPDAVATVRFYHESFSLAQLYIVNLEGYRVRTLVQKYLPGGAYQISWYGESDAARRLAPGIYIMTYRADDIIEKKKVVLH
ncbi:MAG: hypothetical protein Q9P90_02270 [candidate division KSB1 bacterium]|nr:hypothetical protein [candidate division KSB1 bacterium]